jgi:hypothetical protein
MPTGPGRPTASHPATRLTVLLGVRDQTHHHALSVTLMDKARKAGLSGATLFQALEGYGTSGKLHRTHLFAEDAPLNLVIVDTPERIDAFIESVHELLEGVSFLLSPVDVIDF